MNAYFELLLQEINYSIKSLDEQAFNQLLNESISTLQNGGKIVVSGLGKNVPICDKFVGSMLSLGLAAYFLNTNSAVHGDMGVVKKDDLVIILTKSGETVESIYLTQLLKEREANLWLLTFNTDSTLTREIPKNIVLTLNHEGDMWNIMPNNSTTLNLIVLQALAMQIAEKLNLQLADFKRNHPGGFIGETLKNV
ncbi:SIS domain-containing protein [Metasolibacillus meyeri]|uniref:SIS domain-containing protein n=1 Tax=Metasolibacillus meyeri TaxID=1071052 RepID=UPI000D31E593|nr:SIS domain-containing protein [Metasolibacillus meyeri]